MSAELTFIAELLNGVRQEATQAPIDELGTGVRGLAERGEPDPFATMQAYLGSLIRKTGALSCLGEDIGRAGDSCASLMGTIGSDNTHAQETLGSARLMEHSGAEASTTLHAMRLKALDMLDALADLVRQQAELDEMAGQVVVSAEGAATFRNDTIESAQAFAAGIGAEIQ